MERRSPTLALKLGDRRNFMFEGWIKLIQLRCAESVGPAPPSSRRMAIGSVFFRATRQARFRRLPSAAVRPSSFVLSPDSLEARVGERGTLLFFPQVAV